MSHLRRRASSGRVGESAHKLVKHLNNLSPRDYAETAWYHEALEVTGAETYYSETLTIREDPSDSSDVYVLDGQDGRAMIEYFPHRQAWVVTEDIARDRLATVTKKRTRRSNRRTRRTATRHRKASGYWGTVTSMAKEIAEIHEDDSMGEPYDTLHEFVDGSSHIIYTNKALNVLQESNNRNAYFDHMGGSINAKSTDEVMTQLAYYAMYQDVADELYDLGVL